jgi:hypothetical protein
MAASPSNPNIVAATDYNNRIYLSTDRGLSWAATAALPRYHDESVIDLQFAPQNDSLIYASSSYYGIFKSNDRGSTWTNITNGLPVDDGAMIFGPAINPHNTRHMFVSSSHHGVYETRDGGDHWTSFNPGLDTARCFGKIYLAPADTGYVYLATANASVWSIHRTLTDVEGEESNLPHSVALTAYPNPFNAATTITVQGMDEAEIAIYDIAGRNVAALRAEGGRALWEAKGLSSGVYFARAKIRNLTRTISLILLK